MALAAIFPEEALSVLERIEAIEFAWKMDGVPFPPSYGRESPDEAIQPWSIPRPTAWLLYSLIVAARPATILELGTSFAYSTVWLCQAARRVGARVETVELMPEKIVEAKRNLADAGYENFVLHERDAREVCRDWTGPLDFLFMDADAAAYTDYWDCLATHLSPNAVVVADNALTHPHLFHPLLTLLDRQGDFRYFVNPMDNGLLVVTPV